MMSMKVLPLPLPLPLPCLYDDACLFAFLHPTALTALTSLQLYNLGAAVGDTAGLAVAASLRRLRHLALCDCDISSAATKAALRRLPMLTELVMKDAEGGEEGDSEDQEG
jgi:hypothetical protein